MNTRAPFSDVVVVGAGPTGLLLAGDLAEAGVSVAVLERRDGKISNLSRAFAIHARTLELFDSRGVLDDVEKTAVTKLPGVNLYERVRLDISRLPSRHSYVLVNPQYNVERVLLDRALAAGAVVVPDSRFVGLRQDAEGVTATVRADDGVETTYRSSYLIAADGVHSAVREAVGVPFPGKSVLRSLMIADVKLADPPEQVLTGSGNREGFAFVAPFGDGWHRLTVWDRRRRLDDAPVRLEDVADVTRRVLGTDYGMHEARWLSRFHSDERQAPRYRVGRVFLAGDAAHCHSPAGGQGLNTGLQDAANLSWRLAAVQRGAPAELLDDYEAERHPVGRAVLRSSGALIRLALLKSPLTRALRGWIGAAALRFPPIARKVLGEISGLGIAYRRPRGAHKLVGARAPDVPLADGTRLYEVLRGGRFVALGASAVDGWRDRVRFAALADNSHGDLSRAGAVLVRPDGYVAWCDDGNGAALRDQLAGWCGAPAVADVSKPSAS
ncbi:MAG: FAD-dependent monooxygenase [Stackebrandtia sp.]